jgi:DNA polymerase-3 subunit gamma/tau
LHELDAASNNKVDDMRDLLGKVALGTPGRTKVYLLDEVHMLTSGAENALLKTLEEPPEHVVFVLATTEPHKVVETIRSRTQHLELSLLSAETLGSLVADVVAEACLEVDEEGMAHAVRAARGSARDALSALDRVLAGGVTTDETTVADLLTALAEGDSGAALGALAA